MENLQKYIDAVRELICLLVHGMYLWLLGLWVASIAIFVATRHELRTRISTSLRALGVKKDDHLQ